MYNFEVKLTKEDYIEFNTHHAKTSMSMKLGVLFSRFVVPIVYVITPFLLGRGENKILIGAFIAVAVLWIIFFPAYYWKRLNKRINKVLDENKNGDLFKLNKIVVSDNGIKHTAANTKNSVKWSGVKKITQSKKSVFIYISKVQAHIIPKRMFKDQDEMDNFVKYCKGKIGI